MAAINIPGAFRFLDHAAEVKFEAYGDNVEDAFSNALRALVQIVCDRQALQEISSQPVTIVANQIDQLLYDFLSHILVLMDADGFVTADVEDLQIWEENGKWKLSGTLFGQDPRDVQFDTEIKSITYHQMTISQHQGRCAVTVVVDV